MRLRTNPHQRLKRTRSRGAAAIEFGLWLLPIATLLSGIVDLGWYMSRYHMVQRATTDGVRYGVRFASEEDPNSDPQGSKMVPAAEFRANQLLSDFGVSGNPAAFFEPDAPYDQLRMTTTADFQPLVGIIPMPTNIQASFVMISEVQR